MRLEWEVLDSCCLDVIFIVGLDQWRGCPHGSLDLRNVGSPSHLIMMPSALSTQQRRKVLKVRASGRRL